MRNYELSSDSPLFAFSIFAFIMDNITQGVIGGSIYTLITGKKRNASFMLGALITNIPDFDVFIGRLAMSHPLDQFFFHRGIMHSLIFNLILCLILGYVLHRGDRSVPYRRYVLGCFVSIVFGHLLIDGMTSYGMRYFLPWDGTVRSFDNMFVLDFGMWIIVLGGFLTYLFSTAKKKVASWILVLSGLYILLSVSIQKYVSGVFTDHLPAGVSQDQVISKIVMPEPLQIALRRGVVKTNSGIYESNYSIFDDTKNVKRRFSSFNYESEKELMDILNANSYLKPEYEKIINFTRGMYTVQKTSSGYLIQNFIFGPLNGRKESPERSFGFLLEKTSSGYEFKQSQSFGRGINKQTRRDFWERVRGI